MGGYFWYIFRLVDNLWTLDSKLEENSSQLRKGMQQVDIWFEEPYNLMVEFDEKQHFNQFRLITLNESCLFNYEVYESLCKPIRPGTSSFHRLKSSDPFFPGVPTEINKTIVIGKERLETI